MQIRTCERCASLLRKLWFKLEASRFRYNGQQR